MHAFDILAEAKMRQWEQDKRDGKVADKKKEDVVTPESYESLEKQLYYDIRKLMVESYLAGETERQEMQSRANNMLVQLAARLERAGYNIMSKMFADEVQTLKAKACAVMHDKSKLQALLNDLD